MSLITWKKVAKPRQIILTTDDLKTAVSRRRSTLFRWTEAGGGVVEHT